MRLPNSIKDKMCLALGSIAMFAQPVFADDNPALKSAASMKPAGKAVAAEKNGVATGGKPTPTPASSSSSQSAAKQPSKARSAVPTKLTPATLGQFSSPKEKSGPKAARVSNSADGDRVPPKLVRDPCYGCGRG